MNRVFLYGNLGADPELKTTGRGTAVLKLRLATKERQKKNDEWVDHTEWHSVIVWGKRGESLARMLSKGAAVLVEGNLRTTSWEDRNDGKKRYKTEVSATDVRLAGRREGGDGGGRAASSRSRDAGDDDYSPDEPSAGGAEPDYGPDDDIPF